MAHKGGCFCGNVRISYDGEAKMKVLCHCLDCRKMTGSAYSTNIVVTDTTLSIEGTPKEYSKITDGGNKVTSTFCPDCGTTLFRRGTFEGSVVIKLGVMDDVNAFEKNKPGAELYVERRVEWVRETEGARQLKGMGP